MSLSNRTRALLSANMMAAAAAARHYTPKATVNHPIGVIVPGDAFMTEKIRDPDYVPYCSKCELCQRLRRVEDGFECPTCGNKANWDLTKFNGNVDVKYDETIEGHGTIAKPKLGWACDEGKKNTETKPCGRCNQPFFGMRKRKYCIACDQIVDRLRATIREVGGSGLKEPSPYASNYKRRR